jgi:hypothetical protein
VVFGLGVIVGFATHDLFLTGVQAIIIPKQAAASIESAFNEFLALPRGEVNLSNLTRAPPNSRKPRRLHEPQAHRPRSWQ